MARAGSAGGQPSASDPADPDGVYARLYPTAEQFATGAGAHDSELERSTATCSALPPERRPGHAPFTVRVQAPGGVFVGSADSIRTGALAFRAAPKGAHVQRPARRLSP